MNRDYEEIVDLGSVREQTKGFNVTGEDQDFGKQPRLGLSDD